MRSGPRSIRGGIGRRARLPVEEYSIFRKDTAVIRHVFSPVSGAYGPAFVVIVRSGIFGVAEQYVYSYRRSLIPELTCYLEQDACAGGAIVGAVDRCVALIWIGIVVGDRACVPVCEQKYAFGRCLIEPAEQVHYRDGASLAVVGNGFLAYYGIGAVALQLAFEP